MDHSVPLTPAVETLSTQVSPRDTASTRALPLRARVNLVNYADLNANKSTFSTTSKHTPTRASLVHVSTPISAMQSPVTEEMSAHSTIDSDTETESDNETSSTSSTENGRQHKKRATTTKRVGSFGAFYGKIEYTDATIAAINVHIQDRTPTQIRAVGKGHFNPLNAVTGDEWLQYGAHLDKLGVFNQDVTELKAFRVLLRQVRNRESATRTRKVKTVYTTILEAEVTKLRAERERLQLENAQLTLKYEQLVTEYAHTRDQFITAVPATLQTMQTSVNAAHIAAISQSRARTRRAKCTNASS